MAKFQTQDSQSSRTIASLEIWITEYSIPSVIMIYSRKTFKGLNIKKLPFRFHIKRPRKLLSFENYTQENGLSRKLLTYAGRIRLGRSINWITSPSGQPQHDNSHGWTWNNKRKCSIFTNVCIYWEDQPMMYVTIPNPHIKT